MPSPPAHAWITTEADFDALSWHDAPLHGACLTPGDGEVVFDLDWTAEWLEPEEGARFYRSWTAPATLVFRGVTHIQGQMKWPYDNTLLAIARDEPPEESHDLPQQKWWIVKGVVGHLSLAAEGFTQYLRRAPMLVTGGRLSPAQRGGLSFHRGPDRVVVG